MEQITKWGIRNQKMEATFMECPECHCIGAAKHFDQCTRPPKSRTHVRTTQFGPCTFGNWCKMLMDKLNAKPGAKCEIKTNTEGMVALFEI